MAIRAKLAGLRCALLGGLFFLTAAPSVASAHAGHNHAPTTVHSPAQVPVSIAPAAPIEEHGRKLQSPGVGILARDGAAVHLSPEPPKAPQLFHANNCCCGSIACHVGVEVPNTSLACPCDLSQKFDLPPVLPVPKSVWGGIERPPRGPLAL